MRKIRVLIVDDSVVVRRLISDVLAADPSIEVAGVAATGQIAIQKIPQINPDIITLDVEMPVMDGLATLREIRKTYRNLPVIMFSTLTERGASATVDALTHGANDYVTKPANVGSVGAGMQQVHDSLIPKIKALCSRQMALEPNHFTAPAAPAVRPPHPIVPVISTLPPPSPDQRMDILAIATSTGGPNALLVLLSRLPANMPVPIVIVQHMPPMFTRMLAEHLTAKCSIGYSEAVSGDTLYPGHGWIAPGDYHMTVAQEGNAVKIRTHQGPPENSCRPAADVLFRSVAEVFRNKTLGVVLTGMGSDGLRGSECIRSQGGRILAQDEASSVVWGMAGAVAKAGIVDGVWPIDQISQIIIRRLQCGRPGWVPDMSGAQITNSN